MQLTRKRWLLLLLLSAVLASLAGVRQTSAEAAPSPPALPSVREPELATPEGKRDQPADQADEDREAEGGADEYEDTGRSFIYREAVFSSAFSRHSSDRLAFSHRPPGSYVAVDYVRTFTPASRSNRALPGWLQLSAIDLHPRLVYYGETPDVDSMMMMEGNVDWPMPEGDEVAFAPQDFWVRFQLAGRDRLSLRLGQIVLPYGVNPPLAPRQTFILPVEELDLGLKWDWGIGIKGPLGALDWELAATLGSGEAWHSPSFMGGSRPSSHLFTGRIGAPTYWDFQHGLSFLIGELPTLQGPYVVDEFALSRWRVSLDSLYKLKTYLMLGAQLTYGEDGYAGDQEEVIINAGTATAEVFGYRVWVDWVPSVHNDLRIGGQLESLIRDLETPGSTETALIYEIGYSLTTEITLKFDYRAILQDFMGMEDDAFYLVLVYYGS